MTEILDLISEISDFSVEKLTQIIDKIVIKQEDIIKYMVVPKVGELYGRNILFKDTNVEILIITWPPYSFSAIHDHGDSVGCVKIINGSLTNVNYKKKNVNRVYIDSQNNFNEDDVIKITKNIIHKIINQASESAVSLHIYSPPLVKMNQYSLI